MAVDKIGRIGVKVFVEKVKLFSSLLSLSSSTGKRSGEADFKIDASVYFLVYHFNFHSKSFCLRLMMAAAC